MKRILWVVEVDLGDGWGPVAGFVTRAAAREEARHVRDNYNTSTRVVAYEPRRECVWVQENGSYKPGCEGYYFTRPWKYCPRCGGKVRIKPN